MKDPLPKNITNNINNIIYFLVKKIEELSVNFKEQDVDFYSLPELQEHYANLGKTLFSGVCHRMDRDIANIQ